MKWEAIVIMEIKITEKPIGDEVDINDFEMVMERWMPVLYQIQDNLYELDIESDVMASAVGLPFLICYSKGDQPLKYLSIADAEKGYLLTLSQTFIFSEEQWEKALEEYRSFNTGFTSLTGYIDKSKRQITFRYTTSFAEEIPEKEVIEMIFNAFEKETKAIAEV